MRPASRAGLIVAVVLGLTLFTIAELLSGAAAKPKAVVLALREEEVLNAAAYSGYSLQDLWDRVRAIGVNAVVLSPQNVQSFLERGEILHFTDSQAQRWPWMGYGSM